MKALEKEAAAERIKNEIPDWKLNENNELEKTFRVPDFAHSLIFVSSVGWLAESANRYRDININIQWTRVTLRIQTREVEGLTENDFMLAERIDQLPSFIFI